MGERVAIVTDSTNDLTSEILNINDIHVVPLYVNFNDESYKDGVDINTETLYKLVKEKKMLPKTAAVSISDFINKFQELLKNYDSIIFTGISKQMSRTYENACMARDEVNPDKIFIVDSMNLSSGIGLQLLKACKLRDDGHTAKEIYEEMKINVSLVRSQFAIETMDYLYKGGRCTGVQRFFGTMLKIKPVIEVRNGKMDVGKKARGKMKNALDILLSQIESDRDLLDNDVVTVTHSIAPESAAYLIEELKKRFNNIKVVETFAGCVISSHCGKGTIGILYMLDKNKVNLTNIN